MFASQFFQSTSEKAETLVLEVLNDALSFEIKKYTGQKFSRVWLCVSILDILMDRLLNKKKSVAGHATLFCCRALARCSAP